jgi:hypothetical protein
MDEKFRKQIKQMRSQEGKRALTFLASLSMEDDVAAVVRAVSYIEDLLFQLLSRNVERLDLIKPSAFSYSGLVLWCRRFGEVSDEMEKALTLLATIRNSLAHDLMHELNEDDVGKFYNAIPEEPRTTQLRGVLERTGFLAEMQPERKSLRIGLMLLVGELGAYFGEPLPRTRLSSERPTD